MVDPLTGLPGHEDFLMVFENALVQAAGSGGIVSLAMTDIDMFKRINDNQGRDIGDQVIRVVFHHIRDGVGERGTVFRYGGEEAMVLLPGIEKEEAFLLLESLRTEFDSPKVYHAADKEESLRVTFSVGLASFPEDGSRGQDLTRKTADAIHRAKVNGRNRVCLAREEKMVTKTSHYTQGQLERLSELAESEDVGEAVLLREALDDLQRKYKVWK